MSSHDDATGLPSFVRSAGPLLWLVLALAVAARVAFGPHVTDDAFITFRYALHLAALEGFTYNPPAHVLGTTSPLLTLLLAGCRFAGAGPIPASLAIATLADLVTIVATAALLDRAGFRAAGLLAGAAIAVWPGYVTWSVSGMETSLYVALATLSFHALASNRPARAGLWTGLAGLARPDGALVAVVIGACLVWRARRDAARYLAVTALVVLPWLVFATIYFGSPIPASVVAKSAIARPAGAGLAGFGDYFLRGRYLVLSVAAVLGAAWLWPKATVAVRAWQVWWALYAGVFLAANAFVDYLWYFVPLLPLYLGCVAVAAETAARRVARGSPFVRVPPRAALAVALAVVSAVGGWRLARHHGDVEAWGAGRERLYETVATALVNEAGGAPCVLAATEIGALGFYYPGPILDLVGLVSPEAIGRDPGAVLRDSRARWLVTYDTHFDRRIVAEPWFAASFRLVRRVPVGPARALEVYARTPSPCG